MTPYHDQLLATGWTSKDGRLYRRGSVSLVVYWDEWTTAIAGLGSVTEKTPDAALAALRKHLHDRIAEAQQALEDLE